MSDERELVREAALFMDGVKPDWWQHVDPLTFNLDDAELCVCGQNGLDWDELFCNPGAPGQRYDDVTCDRAYEPLWLEEIAARMPAPDREPVPA